MNTIEVKNNEIIKNITTDIEVKHTGTNVINLKIVFNRSTDLKIIYSGLESKLNIEYILKDGVLVNLYEIRVTEKTKVQYNYSLKNNSKLYLYRLNNSLNMREVDIISLNESTQIEFNLRTLATTAEKYDIYVYHDGLNAISTLNNLGVALKGNIVFNVTGVVEKGKKGSVLNQSNQIISLNNLTNQIDPNLLIDQYDVVAEHNALIGKFSYDDIFYLMSRGISEEDSIRLLSTGLVLSNLTNEEIKEEIIKYLNEYWR